MAKNRTLSVLGATKEETITLNDTVFGESWNAALIAQYVRVYLLNQKRNTASTKTRSEVGGTTKKIYKQKGTGRARHGSAKAPVYVGGGDAHGPRGESGKAMMPKKMRRKALAVALSSKVSTKNIYVVSDAAFEKIEKTVVASKKVAALKIPMKKTCIIFPHAAPEKMAFHNIADITATEPAGINAYVVLNSTNIVFSEKALTELYTLMGVTKKA